MQTLPTLSIRESTRKKSFADKSVILAMAELCEETSFRLSKTTLRNRDYTTQKLSRFFGNKPLNRIRPADLIAYQKAQLAAANQSSTINQDLNVLLMLLRRARLWHRFEGRYKPLPRTEPPTARALQNQEVETLYAVAYAAPKRSRAAADALLLALSTGMRQSEIKSLRWENVSFANRSLSICKSKTPAGWRVIQLNETSLRVLQERLAAAVLRGFAEPQHYIFPFGHVDPTRPAFSFYTAWNSLRKKAGVQTRFHDTRHTAATMLSEAGVPEAIIRAQIGHSSQYVLNLYTHPRSEAMRQASDVLDHKPPLPIKTNPHTGAEAAGETIGPRKPLHQKKENLSDANLCPPQTRKRKGRLLR